MNKQKSLKPLHSNKTIRNERFIYNEIKLNLIVKYINVGLTIFKGFLFDCLYTLSYLRRTEGNP